jgi:multiple sugar transport system permease protein
MSLIGPVGRKRPRARLAMALLYAILCVGALTTLYPFVLMISTGLKGPTDQTDNVVVPKYLLDDKELLKKYIDDKYAGDTFNIHSNNMGADASPEVVKKYEAFLMKLPPDYWQAGFRNAAAQVTGKLQIRYHNWLRQRFRTIDDLNKTYIEENVGFQTVSAPPEPFDLPRWKPTPGAKWTDWQIFKQTLPAEFRIPVRTQWLWQRFLASKFKNQMDKLPSGVGHSAKQFYDIALPHYGLPATFTWSLVTKDFADLFLEFKSKEQPRFINNPVELQWSWAYQSGEEMPVASFDEATVSANAESIRREFASRNYGYVLDYILLNGRAVWNTFLFCMLSIITQLTVNPLAAYALSRYPIKASGKIFIFLLATMAFPAEVAMIPSFLLLKDLGLLNTFAALVLPGAASGYMIFLLKGFFDSLPIELFEAGAIDGAKETTMMTRIAFPMSKPVLGYLALLAFMGSYGAFIYAFLIAQDQKIWTLMVWIYQLQNSAAPKAVIMAALTLAAVPTLVVFLCAQRVIMRGIVLPGEK